MRGFSKIGELLSRRKRAKQVSALLGRWHEDRDKASQSSRAQRRADFKRVSPRVVRAARFGRHRRPSAVEIDRGKRAKAVSDYRRQTADLVSASDAYPELLDEIEEDA